MSRPSLCAVLLTAQLATSAAAHASEGSSDSNNSSAEGGTSDNSGHSSDETGNTSDSRGTTDGLDNSDQKSVDSTERSLENSSNESTRETSGGRTGRVFSVATAILVVGGAAATVVRLTRGDAAGARARLETTLRRQHALVMRDVSRGHGPILAGWGRELGLTPEETQAVARSLPGSPAQGALLRALGEDGQVRGDAFARAFVGVLQDTLPAERMRELLARHGVVDPS